MQVITRGSLVFAVFFIAKVFSSCIDDCGRGPFNYNLTSLRIINIVKDGASILHSDTLQKDKIAMQICMSNGKPYCYNPSLFSFTEAVACDPVFTPKQKITAIKIFTMQEISNSIPAGTDVSELFLTNFTSPEKIVPIQNLTFPISLRIDPKFEIYFTGVPESDKAQFIVSSHLDDGSVLSDTSRVIHLIP